MDVSRRMSSLVANLVFQPRKESCEACFIEKSHFRLPPVYFAKIASISALVISTGALLGTSFKSL